MKFIHVALRVSGSVLRRGVSASHLNRSSLRCCCSLNRAHHTACTRVPCGRIAPGSRTVYTSSKSLYIAHKKNANEHWL